jgi:hypothetical protein
VLEVFDSSNRVVRRFSSEDKPESLDVVEKQVNIPTYWIRPPQVLSPEAGMRRFVWDLHYGVLDWMSPQFPIAAIYGDTARNPLGPWVPPGNYSVKLTANGRSYTQPLNVKMDPRVKTSSADLTLQHEIAMRCYEGLLQVREAQIQTGKLREQIKNLRERSTQGLADALSSLDSKLAALEGAGGGPRGGGGRGAAGAAEATLNRMSGELLSLMGLVEGADVRPTTQAVAASEEIQRRFSDLRSRWLEIKDRDVKALNEQLRAASLNELTADR